MKQCSACDRHLFGEEPTCPFCGAEQRTTSASGAGSAMASVTLAFALCVAACGPQLEVESTSGSSTTDDSGPALTTTTTDPVASSTTVGVTTDDGPSTTTIDATTASMDSTDDGACAFYAGCPPDVGDTFECDTFAQDCPEGEKCTPWADDGSGVWNATRCAPIADEPDAPGEPCTVEGSSTSGIDSCVLGAMCFDVDPRTNEGTCVSLCAGSDDAPVCEAPDTACSITNDGALALCLDTCDPLAPACEADDVCVAVNDDFFCVPSSGSTGAYGDPCEALTSCAPGHTCLDDTVFPNCGAGACCTEYCDVSAALPCPEAELGVVCQPWYEDGTAPPGYEDVGVCVLPA